LEGQPVSSAAGEVIDDLHPFGLQEGTNGKGSQSHDRILEIWDVDRIDPASQELRIFIKFREVIPFGRLEFHQHRKFPRIQALFKFHGPFSKDHCKMIN
jgi:hypothetical protein